MGQMRDPTEGRVSIHCVHLQKVTTKFAIPFYKGMRSRRLRLSCCLLGCVQRAGGGFMGNQNNGSCAFVHAYSRYHKEASNHLAKARNQSRCISRAGRNIYNPNIGWRGAAAWEGYLPSTARNSTMGRAASRPRGQRPRRKPYRHDARRDGGLQPHYRCGSWRTLAVKSVRC